MGTALIEATRIVYSGHIHVDYLIFKINTQMLFLTYNLGTNSDVKFISCTKCLKAFTCNSRLKIQLRIHSDGKTITVHHSCPKN